MLVLPRHAQPHPAGGQDRQARAGAEQVGDDRRRRDDLLEIVEEQQQALLAQRPREPIEERNVAALPDPEGLGDRGGDQGRVADRGEADEPHPIGEGRGDLGGHGLRQPGLAHPAGPGQRQQPHIVAAQEAGDGRHLALPADQRRQRSGQRGDGLLHPPGQRDQPRRVGAGPRTRRSQKLAPRPVPREVVGRDPVDAGAQGGGQLAADNRAADRALADAEALGGLAGRQRPGVRSTGHSTAARRPDRRPLVHSHRSIRDRSTACKDAHLRDESIPRPTDS